MRLPKQSNPVMRNGLMASILGARAGMTIDVAASRPAVAHGHIMPAQPPNCGTGNFTGCTIPTPNCPGGCMQVCVSVTGAISNECCPAERCTPPDDCCKQVCCEVKVT